MSKPSAIVIGASRGIGKDLVNKLNAEGYDTYGTADLDDEESLKAAAAKVDSLDLLVVSGAIGKDESYLQLDVEQHRQYYQTNVIGPLSAASAFLPALRNGKQKTIVFITSLGGSAAMYKANYSQPAKDRLPLPKGPYSATKGALNILAVQLFGELEDEDFSVLLIHPGIVQTEMGADIIAKIKQLPSFPFPVISIEESATSIAKTIKSHVDAGKPDFKYLLYSGEDASF